LPFSILEIWGRGNLGLQAQLLLGHVGGLALCGEIPSDLLSVVHRPPCCPS
jgi:hypothetical protein